MIRRLTRSTPLSGLSMTTFMHALRLQLPALLPEGYRWEVETIPARRLVRQIGGGFYHSLWLKLSSGVGDGSRTRSEFKVVQLPILVEASPHPFRVDLSPLRRSSRSLL